MGALRRPNQAAPCELEVSLINLASPRQPKLDNQGYTETLSQIKVAEVLVTVLYNQMSRIWSLDSKLPGPCESDAAGARAC